MLNRSGITKTTLTADRQILANVELQSSVGCVVPQALGVAEGAKKIPKADGTAAMNAVLLHDVDVTLGSANGTALIFGFVNVNRVDSVVAAAIVTAAGAAGASKQITFMKV